MRRATLLLMSMKKKKILTNLSALLDEEIRALSELPDEDLDSMMLVIERAYIHTMIEKSLRSAPDHRVSSEARRLRGG
jgi:hypothetical protein